MTYSVAEMKDLIEWTVFMLVAAFAFGCWVWDLNRPQPASDADKARLDWLQAMAESGVVTCGLEFDGGVFLDVALIGSDEQSLREQNDLRSAIDAARKAMQ